MIVTPPAPSSSSHPTTHPNTVSLHSFLHSQPWLDDVRECPSKEDCRRCNQQRISSCIPITIRFEMASTGLDIWLCDSETKSLANTFNASLIITMMTTDTDHQEMRLCFNHPHHVTDNDNDNDGHVCFRVLLECMAITNTTADAGENSSTPKSNSTNNDDNNQQQHDVEFCTSFVTVCIKFSANNNIVEQQQRIKSLFDNQRRRRQDRRGQHDGDGDNTKTNRRGGDEIKEGNFNIMDLQTNLDRFIASTSTLIMPPPFPYYNDDTARHQNKLKTCSTISTTTTTTQCTQFRKVQHDIHRSVEKSNTSRLSSVNNTETSNSDIIIK